MLCIIVIVFPGNGNPTFEKVKSVKSATRIWREFNTLTVINDQNWQKGRETYLALKQLGSTYMQFIPIVERHVQIQSVTDFSVPSEGYGNFSWMSFMNGMLMMWEKLCRSLIIY